MMRDVFIIADNIISPLGSTAADNFTKLSAAVSGIRRHDGSALSHQPFYASLFDAYQVTGYNVNGHTKFEQLLIDSVSGALQQCRVNPADAKTVLIISSTKGNISLLEDPGMHPAEKLSLHHSAKSVARYCKFVNEPIVLSNACISGLLGMITGMRLIQAGLYEHAVVAGADVVSKFILSGFQSFQAVSDEPCKPFDESRKGINLGEAAGTVILSANPEYDNGIRLTGGSVSNDANHISGPSRTGEELCQAISKAMADADVAAGDIGFISAHGTATLYNDEMEAKAFTMAGLQSVPINSLKGYYGHTLGAAGLVESVISIHSLRNGLIIPTKGFSKPGVSEPVNICSELTEFASQNCLKTASGFGGCNAAVIISKN